MNEGSEYDLAPDAEIPGASRLISQVLLAAQEAGRDVAEFVRGLAVNVIDC